MRIERGVDECVMAESDARAVEILDGLRVASTTNGLKRVVLDE